MTAYDKTLDWLSLKITSGISCEPNPEHEPIHTDVARLSRVLRPGDVVLVNGCDRVSAAIRYLTQSSWSHAALYVGPEAGLKSDDGTVCELVEVNLGEGCVARPLSKYKHSPTRICRPINLTEPDRKQLLHFMIDRLGLQYDVRNVVDLARYLIPQPPVPQRWRRKMLAFGSGEPTRAICSTLIAQAFQSIGYPILPKVEANKDMPQSMFGYTAEEIFHIRHHSLFTPRDFDLSPYFDVVKATVVEGFNYKGIVWSEAGREMRTGGEAAEPTGDEQTPARAGQAGE